MVMHQRALPAVAERLAAFFSPRSVALIGATDRSRWSVNTFENLRAFSPELPVYCVHPRHQRVHGRPAYPSLRAVDGPVDLAYVMVPTDQVLPVLVEAAELGVRHAVVLTSGFAEAGAEGRELQDRLVALAAERDLVVLGPNGNGFVNASAQLA